jgi:hypothetical protein
MLNEMVCIPGHGRSYWFASPVRRAVDDTITYIIAIPLSGLNSLRSRELTDGGNQSTYSIQSILEQSTRHQLRADRSPSSIGLDRYYIADADRVTIRYVRCGGSAQPDAMAAGGGSPNSRPGYDRNWARPHPDPLTARTAT